MTVTPEFTARLTSAALVLTCVMTNGCASIIQKHNYDFKTTALFRKPCDLPPPKRDEPQQPIETAKTESMQAAASPKDPMPVSDAAPVRTANDPVPVSDPAPGRTVQVDAACNGAYMVAMAERFMGIQEADDAKGILGDSIEDVRRKGFSIYLDPARKVRRQNTKPLYGAEALAAVGMGVSPPPLQKPEDVKAYTEYIGQHYAEEYYERDVTNVSDRFCLNKRESLEVGDERTFTILWRNGRVIKRVVKGGPVLNPKSERGFLVCPSQFIMDAVTGRISSTINGFAISP